MHAADRAASTLFLPNSEPPVLVALILVTLVVTISDDQAAVYDRVRKDVR